MSVLGVLASSAGSDFSLWSDLLEVVLYGLGAGIGLSIAFGLAMRGWILGTTPRPDGTGGPAGANLAMAVFFSVLCVAAVAFALASMLHR